jgi:tRNA(Ile)-lysidine synthase
MHSFFCTKKQFEHLPIVLQRFVLQVVYEHFHGSTEDLSFDHLEHVRNFILRSTTGKKQVFGKHCMIQNSYATMTFQSVGTHKNITKEPSKTQLVIPGKTIWNGFTLTAQTRGKGQLQMAYASHQKLFVRSWRKGDLFTPLGMRGRKKLQDFFTDEKIPKQQRESLPLIVDEHDNIIAVYNLRIDDTVKITATTKKTLTLSIVP